MLVMLRQGWWCWQVPGSHCLHGAACEHFFCIPCLVQHAQSLIHEGAGERLQCPEPGCQQNLLLQVSLHVDASPCATYSPQLA